MQEDTFLDYFTELDDPRIDRKKLHPVEEILLLTFCGVICGCDGWKDVERFGKAKLSYLKRFLSYEHGIPSDDTLRRFFRSISPEQFRSCFMSWVKSLQISQDSGVIAIDGKTSRCSFDDEKFALHLVSAFASEARMVLGQVTTDEKSNEITAIPKLLDLLDIQGSLVSIDAMGCQHAIAKKIIDGGGDYLLSLKGNQGTLHDDVRTHFNDKADVVSQVQQHIEYDKGHGRFETRVCRVINDLDYIKKHHEHWQHISSIIEITSTREIAGNQQQEKRYYISSSDKGPEVLLAATRSHWSIENQLHWVLDMSFGDDQSRIRKGNAPENIAIVRHVALNMMRTIKQKYESIKLLRKAAGWDDSVLDRIILQKF